MEMGKAGSPARRPLHDSVEVRGHGVEVLLVVRPGSHLDADLQEDCLSGGGERDISDELCLKCRDEWVGGGTASRNGETG